MSLPMLASDFMSVVVRGEFAPREVTPAWLYSKGLIGLEEFSESNHEIFVADDINAFSVGWLRCETRKDLFQVSTTKEDEFERLRDVAVGVLRELKSVPVGAMGINRNMHFHVPDRRAYDAIGDAIVPKEIWDGVLILPGMRSATIWAVRPDLYSGRIEVRVEPSSIIQFGVFVAYNDHYALETVDAQPRARDDDVKLRNSTLDPTIEKNATAIRVLMEEWGTSMVRSTSVIARIAEKGKVTA